MFPRNSGEHRTLFQKKGPMLPDMYCYRGTYMTLLWKKGEHRTLKKKKSVLGTIGPGEHRDDPDGATGSRTTF